MINSCKVGGIRVCSGYLNKVPQTGQLKQQQFISYSSAGWEISDQGANQVAFTLSFFLLACMKPPSPLVPVLVHVW